MTKIESVIDPYRILNDLSRKSVALVRCAGFTHPTITVQRYLSCHYPAKRFFKRLLKAHNREPRKIVTDKLKSYGVAHRELMSDAVHDTSQYSNNRAELSHQPTRVRERGMRRFKSVQQAQRFFSVHAAVHNLFNLGRHLVSAKNYRYFRSRAFSSWSAAVA